MLKSTPPFVFIVFFSVLYMNDVIVIRRWRRAKSVSLLWIGFGIGECDGISILRIFEAMILSPTFDCGAANPLIGLLCRSPPGAPLCSYRWKKKIKYVSKRKTQAVNNEIPQMWWKATESGDISAPTWVSCLEQVTGKGGAGRLEKGWGRGRTVKAPGDIVSWLKGGIWCLFKNHFKTVSRGFNNLLWS